MGVDEFEKDSFCNPVNNAPSRKEWNKILICTIKRANLLNIELYQ